MTNPVHHSGVSTTPFRFKLRDMVRPLLPSDIQQAWSDAGTWFRPAIGASLQFLDPVFHPAEFSELEAWVGIAVRDIAKKKQDLKVGIKSGEASLRDFQDCDDSAFSLKSAASAYRDSILAAPLCVGIVGCRTKQGRDHMLNWFVSVEIAKPAKHPEVDFKLWFADIMALVEVRSPGANVESTSPPGPSTKMIQILASPEEVSRYFRDPYLILV